MLNIISLGAGVQSSTMSLMAMHKEIDPIPDAAIFADTQAEPEAVYTWLNWLESMLPFPVYRVSKGSLWDHEWNASMRKGGSALMVPYKSKGGLIRRQCTNHFKIRPIDRKLRELRNNGKVTLWIGISTDEASRMKPAQQKYKTHRWPLIELDMNRQDCLDWMKDKGYDLPPRSACIFCPYKGINDWKNMDQKDFNRAVVFDEHMRNRGGEFPLYIWRDKRPLKDVAFSSKEEEKQITPFGEDCEGMCGV